MQKWFPLGWISKVHTYIDSMCINAVVNDVCCRTIGQAEKLDVMLDKRKEPLDSVVEFAIDDSLLVRRICGRWFHLARLTYNFFHNDFYLVAAADLIMKSSILPEFLVLTTSQESLWSGDRPHWHCQAPGVDKLVTR